MFLKLCSNTNSNVVNDSIELFQILAVEIPLSFLENNAPPGPVINAEEIQMVEPEIAEEQVVELPEEEEELTNINKSVPLEEEDEEDEDIPLLQLATKKSLIPEPPKPQTEVPGSLSRQYKDLNVEKFGRGLRKKI